MARINVSKFAGRKGATLACDKCRQPIAVGEQYRYWAAGFRSRRKNIRCMRATCSPRASEMTNSKMSGVYAAQEEAEDALNLLQGAPEENWDSVRSILEDAASAIEDVAQEYRDAADASPTGLVFGEDLNERADMIEEGANEIRDWEPDEDEPDFDECAEEHHDEPENEGDIAIERGDVERCESCKTVQQDWWDNLVAAAIEAVNGATFE